MNLGYENNKVSCLKQGGKMSNFCLKQGQVLKTLGSSPTTRASDRLRKKVKFRGNFWGKLHRKAISKKTADSVVVFKAHFPRNRLVLH